MYIHINAQYTVIFCCFSVCVLHVFAYIYNILHACIFLKWHTCRGLDLGAGTAMVLY